MLGTLGRRTPGPDGKKKESFVDKLTGTLSRKKKPQAEEENLEENKVLELELECHEALDSSLIPTLAKNIWLEEETARDQKVGQVVDLLIYWLNEEIAEQRIVVRHIQEDMYDGQIIQKLLEKLEQIRIEVPEVSQSEEGQRQKLQIVIQTANRVLNQPQNEHKWTAELVHDKDITAILQLLRRCTYLVLDEAERVFKMGFEPQLMKVVSGSATWKS